MMVMLTLTKEVNSMILVLINAHRATLNKEPKYNVQMKSVYPITYVPYVSGCGEDSFEIIHKNMNVTVNLINGDSVTHVCDRVIEEFDKLLLIKNFKQVSFELMNIKSIVVK